MFVVNSVAHSDAIYECRTWSTLVQIMACCLTAPSHYLNQRWLIISEVQLYSLESNPPKMLKILVIRVCCKIAYLKLLPCLSVDNKLNHWPLGDVAVILKVYQVSFQLTIQNSNLGIHQATMSLIYCIVNWGYFTPILTINTHIITCLWEWYLYVVCLMEMTWRFLLTVQICCMKYEICLLLFFVWCWYYIMWDIHAVFWCYFSDKIFLFPQTLRRLVQHVRMMDHLLMFLPDLMPIQSFWGLSRCAWNSTEYVKYVT